MNRAMCCVMSMLFAMACPAMAASLAGVEMPDTFDLGGNELVLNGLGLREATFLKVNVYVAGLYLPRKTADAAVILEQDEPAALHMKFVRKVGRDDLTEAWTEGFEKNGAGPELEERIARLNGWMTDLSKGDEMRFEYLPGEGVDVTVKGESKGRIEGADFARALWSIWLGPNPPNPGLKKGLLGG